MGSIAKTRDIAHYFEYSGVGLVVEEDGLKEIHFGEFLVEMGVLTRAQLFQALSEQDRKPNLRIGELVVGLGFMPDSRMDQLLMEYNGIHVVEIA